MPGPVSDSYDPEFGTGDNACAVRDGIQLVINRIQLGALKNIVEVAHSKNGKPLPIRLSEREWRLVRFGLRRALEDI